MIEPLLQRWQQLSSRERRLLVAALGVAGLSLIYLALIEPA